jgi:hypothetical protein
MTGAGRWRKVKGSSATKTSRSGAEAEAEAEAEAGSGLVRRAILIEACPLCERVAARTGKREAAEALGLRGALQHLRSRAFGSQALRLSAQQQAPD